MQDGKPGESEPGPEPQGDSDKLQQLADDAVAAGKRALETDTGKKVAELAETGFAKAEKLLDDALSSETGSQVKAAAEDAAETGKQFLSTNLGKNVAIGAGAGAVAGLVLPFVGTIVGAVVGAGLGYLRTITKKD
jgi:ElaB/YqjD/DUF883 family membrane-anchored ribosome-binding protein